MARLRRVPPSLYPHGIEQDYYRALRLEIDKWFKALKARLLVHPGTRKDSLFEGAFEEATIQWALAAAYLKTVATSSAQRMIRVVEKSFGRQQVAALANTVQGISLQVGSAPFGMYQAEIESFSRANALLIKDIGEKAARDIELLVQDAVSRGTLGRDLAKILKETQGYTNKRAALIARDQIGKLNGNLQQIRMKEAGIDRYQWQTMQDRRVRPEHVVLNGTIRTWEQSPRPGEEIRCRCTPIPLFE